MTHSSDQTTPIHTDPHLDFEHDRPFFRNGDRLGSAKRLRVRYRQLPVRVILPDGQMSEREANNTDVWSESKEAVIPARCTRTGRDLLALMREREVPNPDLVEEAVARIEAKKAAHLEAARDKAVEHITDPEERKLKRLQFKWPDVSHTYSGNRFWPEEYAERDDDTENTISTGGSVVHKAIAGGIGVFADVEVLEELPSDMERWTAWRASTAAPSPAAQAATIAPQVLADAVAAGVRAALDAREAEAQPQALSGHAKYPTKPRRKK